MTTIFPQCMTCRHLSGHHQGTPKCKAYPKGIPDQILLNKVDHRKPYEGDQGIVFEAEPGKRYPY